MSLKYSVTAASEIDERLKKEMFLLFRQYYADVSFERFAADLREKNSVIMLWDRSAEPAPYLFGFSTILLRELPDGGRTIYSGDTVVDRDYWGSRTLQSAFSRVLLLARLRYPFSPLYWMLISKGFKTYMLMRRNFPCSYPSRAGIADAEIAKVKDEFYQNKFGACYNSQTSIIDFGTSMGRVKDQIAVPTEKDRANSDVQFFLENNPRFHEGVELACIANIRWSDIAHIMFKYAFPFMKRLSLPPILVRYFSR
jgi:hypothetical protein